MKLKEPLEGAVIVGNNDGLRLNLGQPTTISWLSRNDINVSYWIRL